MLRSQLGGSVGRRLINSNRAQIDVGAGLVGNYEQGVDTGSARNFEGLLAFHSAYDTYDRPKTSLEATAQYYPSLNNWNRQRLQVDGSLKPAPAGARRGPHRWPTRTVGRLPRGRRSWSAHVARGC